MAGVVRLNKIKGAGVVRLNKVEARDETTLGSTHRICLDAQ